MMSGVPLETCWAFNKLWNNKFCYKLYPVSISTEMYHINSKGFPPESSVLQDRQYVPSKCWKPLTEEYAIMIQKTQILSHICHFLHYMWPFRGSDHAVIRLLCKLHCPWCHMQDRHQTWQVCKLSFLVFNYLFTKKMSYKVCPLQWGFYLM
jgi:hypothetical protein